MKGWIWDFLKWKCMEITSVYVFMSYQYYERLKGKKNREE